MLIGVGDALVVLVFVFVLDGIRRGVAAQPELLDEIVALFVVAEALEGIALFIGDDVDDVFVQPLLVDLAANFTVESLSVFLPLLVVDGTLERINAGIFWRNLGLILILVVSLRAVGRGLGVVLRLSPCGKCKQEQGEEQGKTQGTEAQNGKTGKLHGTEAPRGHTNLLAIVGIRHGSSNPW